MTTIEGTPAQVEWAEKIRTKSLETANARKEHFMKDYDPEFDAEDVAECDEIINFLSTAVDAAAIIGWWKNRQ